METDPMSRTTAYFSNVKRLADAIGCQATNADVVLVKALTMLTEQGLNKDLTRDEWMKLGTKFFRDERA